MPLRMPTWIGGLSLGSIAVAIVVAVWLLGPPLLIGSDDRTDLVRTLWVGIGFATAVAVVTMFITRAAVTLLPLRARTQRRLLAEWLGDEAFEDCERLISGQAEPAAASEEAGVGPAAEGAGADERARGPEADSGRQGGADPAGLRRSLLGVFDAPLEELTGQIAAASEIVQVSPSEHFTLAQALSGWQDSQELSQLREAGPLPPKEHSQDYQRYVRAHAVVAQDIQRNIDLFQLTASSLWARRLRATTFVLAGALSVLIAAVAVDASDEARSLLVIAGGLLGGPLSWTVRDLVALVERARR